MQSLFCTRPFCVIIIIIIIIIIIKKLLKPCVTDTTTNQTENLVKEAIAVFL